MLYLKSFTFNPFQQNTFIVYDEKGDALIVDAGNSDATENNELRSFIAEKKISPSRLLLTHAHIDHVLGNKFIYDEFGLLPEVHESELFFIDNLETTAGMYGVAAAASPRPVSFLSDGQKISLGSYTFECILAPGHSPGSICFYNAQNRLLLGGDVLFNGSIGRTDLPMGNHEQLLNSIRTRLFVLPDETRVYCGHGPFTTIGHERKTNPFLADH